MVSISVFFPCYNEQENVRRTVEKALDVLEKLNADFEVIIVDDGSKTSLDEIVGAFRKRINVKLLRQDHAGPAAARNMGGNESA